MCVCVCSTFYAAASIAVQHVLCPSVSFFQRQCGTHCTRILKVAHRSAARDAASARCGLCVGGPIYRLVEKSSVYVHYLSYEAGRVVRVGLE